MPKTKLPISKSWAIRMIFLDMIYGQSTGYRVIRYFRNQSRNILAGDIKAALSCVEAHMSGRKTFNVGNSGTVCRFLIYFLDGKKYKIKKGRQLLRRKIIVPKNLSALSLSKLLELGTSQFASAALLKGMKPIKNLPPKCQLSIQARRVYFKNRGEWIPRNDEVISRQIKHFLSGGKFRPLIAEDYCYARAFSFITQKEGKRRWPELANHECNRLKVMEEVCKNFNKKVNVHNDHRVAMAAALRQKSLGLPVRLNNRGCVSKSWPQFWHWLKENSLL